MILRVLAAFAAIVLDATALQAQQVAMAGQYNAVAGIVAHLPHGGRIVDCDPAQNDARCLPRNQKFFGFQFDAASDQPIVGVRAAQLIDTIGGAGNGLAVGDPFLVPPLAFQQNNGPQVTIYHRDIERLTRQIETDFTALAPGTARAKGNTTLTRRFSAANWAAPGNGQNNGLTGSAAASRLAATTAVTRTVPDETVAVAYTPGKNQFGGTATILLEGTGRRLAAGPSITAIFLQQAVFTSGAPYAISIPYPENASGFNTRDAAGWDYTVPGILPQGRIRGFFQTNLPNYDIVAQFCTDFGPEGESLPMGCNEINGFDANGYDVGPTPAGGTSVRHLFAWTTGTVSIVRTAIRNGNTQTDTVTGMGYDTTQTSSGGAITQRNVGLIAGSYATRTLSPINRPPRTEIDSQMVGMNLKFTPEPGTTVALVSGLGLLGGLAVRRRTRAQGDAGPRIETNIKRA